MRNRFKLMVLSIMWTKWSAHIFMKFLNSTKKFESCRNTLPTAGHIFIWRMSKLKPNPAPKPQPPFNKLFGSRCRRRRLLHMVNAFRLGCGIIWLAHVAAFVFSSVANFLFSPKLDFHNNWERWTFISILFVGISYYMLLSLDLNVADKFNWFIINLTKQSIFELTNKKFAFGLV